MNGEKYYELTDLVSQINGTLSENQMLSMDIEWLWDYYGDDVKDTLEGDLALDYSFQIALISIKE